MRIQRITIGQWRHFNEIELIVPEQAPVICLVGGNGTGKSQILELIASCAQTVGLTHGFQSGRGNPLGEPADLEVQFHIAAGSVPTLDEPWEGLDEEHAEDFVAWDRTLTVTRTPQNGPFVFAGPEDLPQKRSFGQHLVNRIRSSTSVHYLMLDADRAYPRVDVNVNELGVAFQTDWEGERKGKSHLQTKSLYEEWFKYLLGTESQQNNKYVADIRRARENGLDEPTFVDLMKAYKEAVQKVLPHLLFTGVDPHKRQVHFDSSGKDLAFDQLSGGEREIAFLVGQIERFGLRKGLLLVDEPELHLNYDLLRSWIGFLKATVEEGQMWLATHSLEVVEVTGPEATFLLEREDGTRKVTRSTRLSARPIVSTLSRAIGSPAFSINSLTFVFVEGEEEIGERERFRMLCDMSRNVRFLEGGSCNEVRRRLDGLKAIAGASGESLRIGAVIDGDWRSSTERGALTSEGLFVLGVHEVENFFLHPPTVKRLMRMLSKDASNYDSALQSATDARAGTWIFNAARTDKKFWECPPPSPGARELAHRLSWIDFAHDNSSVTSKTLAAAHGGLSADQENTLAQHLEVRARSYGRIRDSDELWRRCEGKQVFRSLAQTIGVADVDTAERAMTNIWKDEPSLIPIELEQLRSYVAGLGE